MKAHRIVLKPAQIVQAGIVVLSLPLGSGKRESLAIARANPTAQSAPSRFMVAAIGVPHR